MGPGTPTSASVTGRPLCCLAWLGFWEKGAVHHMECRAGPPELGITTAKDRGVPNVKGVKVSRNHDLLTLQWPEAQEINPLKELDYFYLTLNAVPPPPPSPLCTYTLGT